MSEDGSKGGMFMKRRARQAEPCLPRFESLEPRLLLSGVSDDVLFDEAVYLADNADVAAAVQAGTFSNGLEHYRQFGLSVVSVSPLACQQE